MDHFHLEYLIMRRPFIAFKLCPFSKWRQQELSKRTGRSCAIADTSGQQEWGFEEPVGVYVDG